MKIAPLTIYPSKMVIWTSTIIYLGLLVYSAVSLPKLRDFLELEVGVFIPVWRGVVIVGGLVVLWSHLWRKTTVCVVNEKEVIHYKGIISKSSATLPLDRISSFSHLRPWWKRILGVSDLTIVTTGDAAEIKVVWISNPDSRALITRLEANRKALMAA